MRPSFGATPSWSSVSAAPGTRSGIWPPRRALVSEAGWLAVEHGWPHLAARAAVTYGWLTGPGVVDPTATELVRAVLDMGADDDWRPALVAIAAGLELAGRWSLRP